MDADLLEALLSPPPLNWAVAAYDGIIHLDFIRCPGLSGQSGSARVSESCSALAFGPGGPLPLRDFAFGFGAGCSFRRTTYRLSAYTQPSGIYDLPLHHPRFLEWIGTPESASLLKKGPGTWLHSLSREQAIDAARQLHRDVCLMFPGFYFCGGGCRAQT